MKQVVFRMKLKPGCEVEYRKRHEVIWPELVTLLKQNGIKNYNIYLDKETDTLIAVQHVDEGLVVNLHENPLMLKWWEHMADLMEVNPGQSPVVVDLEKVFSMP
ncbi:L-rhamnose mutarotase [Mucilaginibacter rigui]|uniref:L-rhamnose mutarotase n=1 Tax=Mucilaginibacter rigui TaxID=534635 RepID=A0ABR7X191_9SPHI|nr:L-rhamnose mutarotase [Mucilaginibacter rigui]MBD1384354.1 L-rhamnose mutarotase [Mucilaginibacter rigui]